MTRFDSISSDLAILLSVPNAPTGSELRFEMAPGTELVATGPDLALELGDLNQLLAGCEEGCEFPVRVNLTEGEPGAVYEFRMSQIGGQECGDRQAQAWIR